MPIDRRDLLRGLSSGKTVDRGAGGQAGAENGRFWGFGVVAGGNAGGDGTPLRQTSVLFPNDDTLYEGVGRALALWVEYAELRGAGAPSAARREASAAAARAWFDVARAAWSIARSERFNEQHDRGSDAESVGD